MEIHIEKEINADTYDIKINYVKIERDNKEIDCYVLFDDIINLTIEEKRTLDFLFIQDYDPRVNEENIGAEI